MEILKELDKLFYIAKSIDVVYPLDRVAMVDSIYDLMEAAKSGDISHTFNELYRYRKLYNAEFSFGRPKSIGGNGIQSTR